MKIEAGKKYVDINGKIIGPMQGPYNGSFIQEVGDGMMWNSEGKASTRDCVDLVSEYRSSPIREITKRELVPGIYGRFKLMPTSEQKREIGMQFVFRSGPGEVAHPLLNAEELREAAHLFNQLAEFLESSD